MLHSAAATKKLPGAATGSYVRTGARMTELLKYEVGRIFVYMWWFRTKNVCNSVISSVF